MWTSVARFICQIVEQIEGNVETDMATFFIHSIVGLYLGHLSQLGGAISLLSLYSDSSQVWAFSESQEGTGSSPPEPETEATNKHNPKIACKI